MYVAVIFMYCKSFYTFLLTTLPYYCDSLNLGSEQQSTEIDIS